MAKKGIKKTTTAKNGPSFLLPLIILAGIFIAILFGWQKGFLTKKTDISSNDLAQTLLTKEEMETAAKMEGKLAPTTIEFNQSFDLEYDAKYGNELFVARITYDRSTGKNAVENALLGFDSNEKAENFIKMKAQEAGNANVTYSFDGKVPTLTLVSANTPDSQGSVNMRFAIGRLVTRIQVYGDVETMKTAEVLLTPIALDLATKQKEKMESLLAGSLRAPSEPQNNSMARLPKNINGATVVGSFPVTIDEWLGITEDFQKDTLPGLVSGGLSRYRLDSRPKDAVEVTVLEFASNQDALNYQNTFFTEGAHLKDTTSKKFDLPESLSGSSVARTSDNVDELAAVKGNYYIDISIISPFGEFNRDVATADLIRVSEEVVSGFIP